MTNTSRPTPSTFPVLAIAGICVIVDQVSKWWALSSLVPGEYHALVGQFFGIQLISNPGAAFSLGDGHTWIFTVIAAVVVIGAWWILGRITNRAWRVTIAVFLGGAIGNLIDRLIQPPAFARGHVIDFLAYSNWFVGNIADIFLVGAALAIGGLTIASVPLEYREVADES
ncbi:MAG: signal peptidase II [Bowdeniella nasicola]|nr:signal peptidase II [Bowdeniella nasicola]